MSKFKVKVDIKIVEVSDEENDASLNKSETDAGKYLIGDDAGNIDKMESLVMDESYEAIRGALSQHFAEFSKKKPKGK